MSGTYGDLVIRLGNEDEREFALESGTFVVGRSPDADISLPHPIISRRHAEIRVTPEAITITDTGSSNGTRLSGVRIPPHQPHTLEAGSQIQIGPCSISVRIGREESGEDEELAGEPIEADPGPDAYPAVAEFVPASSPAPPRLTLPAPALDGPQSTYLRHLPGIYQDNDFLGRFLLIFESLWEPLEQRQDQIPLYFNPGTAPRSFLPWIASWFDLSTDSHWSESRTRELLSEAVDIYRWRGTAYGMSRMIEISTGGTARIDDDPATPFVFQVRVTLPEASETSDDLLHRLIRSHKPAHTGYTLEVIRT